MKKIWKVLGGIAAGIAGLFYLLFQTAKAQRNTARRERDQVKAHAKATQTVRETEQAVNSKANEVRQRNEQARQKRNETSKSDRRRGRFGTADRLRD